jgi:hypothetical protein
MFINWIKEWFDSIKDKYPNNEIIEIVNDIINDLQKHKNDCIKTLKNVRDDFCYEVGYCPMCGNEMHYESWIEDRGEYQGFPVEETVGEMVCEECGYTY